MKAQIWNKSWWIEETREKALDRMLTVLARHAGFNVLKTIEHEFKPYGYTKVWLLAESHLALHTFPEEGKSYIELSSCNAEKQERFAAAMDNIIEKKGCG